MSKFEIMKLASVFLLAVFTFMGNSVIAQYKLDTALMGANKVQFISAKEGFAYPDYYCINATDIIYHTTDTGKTWRIMATNFKTKAGGHPAMLNMFFLDSMTAWMITYDAGRGFLHKTVDGGTTWQQKIATTGDTTNVFTSKFFYNVYFANANDGWITGDQVILHTTDGGNTWTQQFFLNWRPGYVCLLQTVFSLSSNNVYVVGNGGLILHTLDAGTHWAIQNIDTLTLFSGAIADENCFTIEDVKFTDSLHGYTACWLGGYMTTSDAGAHWTKSHTTHLFDNVGVAAVDQNNLWLTGGPYCDNTGCYTYSTIFHSANAGTTWDTILYRPEVYNPNAGGFLKIKFVNPGLAFTGNSHGFILRIKDSSAVTTGVHAVSPKANSISIYPNPANDVITVNCDKQIAGTGIIKIYNSLGKEVMSEQLKTTNTLISVGSLSAGIYLCKIYIDGHWEVRELSIKR